MKKFLVIPVMFMLAGCFSSKAVNLNTVKSWEKSYKSSDSIVVNGEKIDADGDVIWIITGKTFYNLITECVDGKVDETSITISKE